MKEIFQLNKKEGFVVRQDYEGKIYKNTTGNLNL